MDTKFALDDDILEQATGGVRSLDSKDFQVNVRKDDKYNGIFSNLVLNHGSISRPDLEKAAQLLLDAKNQYGPGKFYVVISKTGVTVER